MTDQEKAGPIYVASRASIIARAEMWRTLRDDEGWNITSTWIDEAGEGETADFTELWDRIMREIAAARKVVFFALPSDFPLKGAILEAGIALGMGKPVVVCLPGVELEGRTYRPLGSWIKHRNVIRCDTLRDAMGYHNFERTTPLVDRLRRHARDFRLTESEAERPGNVATDLDLAAEAISNLVVELAHAHP